MPLLSTVQSLCFFPVLLLSFCQNHWLYPSNEHCVARSVPWFRKLFPDYLFFLSRSLCKLLTLKLRLLFLESGMPSSTMSVHIPESSMASARSLHPRLPMRIAWGMCVTMLRPTQTKYVDLAYRFPYVLSVPVVSIMAEAETHCSILNFRTYVWDNCNNVYIYI